jgi:tripartite ATP-independent transporter DctM subunit
LSLIIFLVLGLIFLGIATPSEASALGALGAFFLAIVYGKANLLMVKKSVKGATKTAVSILMILSGSLAFSQILAFTGVSRGFIKFATGLQVEPIMVIIGMLFILVLLGIFLDQISIIMLAAPLYIPVVKALGLDPLWFGIVLLITIELGVKTPPFGLLLFVMKGVTPPDTTMADIYRAAVPFIFIELITIGTFILFPSLVTWLPAIME